MIEICSSPFRNFFGAPTSDQPRAAANRFLQTQTVFKSSQPARAPGLMPPPAPASASRKRENTTDQYEKLRAENAQLVKEKSAKMGEISGIILKCYSPRTFTEF